MIAARHDGEVEAATVERDAVDGIHHFESADEASGTRVVDADDSVRGTDREESALGVESDRENVAGNVRDRAKRGAVGREHPSESVRAAGGETRSVGTEGDGGETVHRARYVGALPRVAVGCPQKSTTRSRSDDGALIRTPSRGRRADDTRDERCTLAKHQDRFGDDRVRERPRRAIGAFDRDEQSERRIVLRTATSVDQEPSTFGNDERALQGVGFAP